MPEMQEPILEHAKTIQCDQGGDGVTGMKAAVYLRVSKEEQTEANQEPEIYAAIERNGDILTKYLYRERISGKREDRKELQRMLRDAMSRHFNVVYVYKLDRLARTNTLMNKVLAQLDASKVSVFSVKDTLFNNFSDPMFRPLIISIFGIAAEIEVRSISERTKAGLRRARAEAEKEGRPWRTGRPDVTALIAEEARRLSSEHPELSPRRIAEMITYKGKRGQLKHPAHETVRKVLRNSPKTVSEKLNSEKSEKRPTNN